MKNLKIFEKLVFGLLLLLLLTTFASAKRAQTRKPRLLPLTSIHIIDRNGFSETISNKDRLEQFQQADFLKSQPYQKILRIYARDVKGNIRSVVNTYYDNGNPKQFLEILNARANGNYYEWHENGNMSLMAKIIGGTPDVTPIAERSWLFDGPSYIWTEEGHLLAELSYSQGSLEGWSIYYHPSGQIWKRLFFLKNQADGVAEIFKSDGELLQQVNYVQGKKHGDCLRHWDSDHLASQEEYVHGKLINGQYFDKQGNVVAEIKDGQGYRAVFGRENIQELQQFTDGILEGEVKVFNAEGCLKRLYHVRNGIKHGEETEFYERHVPSSSSQPKISFYWFEGKIQGHVKTWYSNGTVESQREMSNNAKNGVLTAWYRDGNLMLIEEYETDKLMRGDYFKHGEKVPVSQVNQGKGVVTLFDADGHYIQKINYLNGQPETPAS